MKCTVFFCTCLIAYSGLWAPSNPSEYTTELWPDKSSTDRGLAVVLLVVKLSGTMCVFFFLNLSHGAQMSGGSFYLGPVCIPAPQPASREDKNGKSQVLKLRGWNETTPQMKPGGIRVCVGKLYSTEKETRAWVTATGSTIVACNQTRWVEFPWRPDSTVTSCMKWKITASQTYSVVLQCAFIKTNTPFEISSSLLSL